MRSELPAGWRHAALGDLIKVHHGFAFRGEFFRDKPPGDLLLTPGNFSIGGGFNGASRKYYVGPVDERFVLSEGVMLITMTDLSRNSDTLGSPAIIPPSPDGARFLHNQRLGRVELMKGDLLDCAFLYAALRTSNYRHQIVASATGTTVKHTSPSKIGAALIPLPPIAEQSRIAFVLGALDDKIDSNRRLARLLEQIAQTEFQARFVDFVGVEDFEDSELGRIPSGWQAGVLGDIGAVYRDFVKGASELPYIGLDQMPRGSTVLTDWSEQDAPAGQAARFEIGDVLFGKLRPYFRKVGVAPIAGRCSTEILVLRPAKSEYYGVLLGHVASEAFIEHCVAVSRGTRMPRAEWKDASAFEIAIPPIEEAAVFTALAHDFYAKIRCLTHESRTLAAIRDALLPKLISGEVRVPDTADPDEVIEPLVNEAA